MIFIPTNHEETFIRNSYLIVLLLIHLLITITSSELHVYRLNFNMDHWYDVSLHTFSFFTDMIHWLIRYLSKDVKVSFTSFSVTFLVCQFTVWYLTLFFIVWRSDSTLCTCLCSHSECSVLIGDLINWTVQDMMHGTNYIYHWIPFLSSFKWDEVFICLASISIELMASVPLSHW